MAWQLCLQLFWHWITYYELPLFECRTCNKIFKIKYTGSLHYYWLISNWRLCCTRIFASLGFVGLNIAMMTISKHFSHESKEELRIKSLLCQKKSWKLMKHQAVEKMSQTKMGKMIFLTLFSWTRRQAKSQRDVKKIAASFLDEPPTKYILATFATHEKLKLLFVTYNTALLSSAAVERLFSTGKDVFRPKRVWLSDEYFNMLVFFKASFMGRRLEKYYLFCNTTFLSLFTMKFVLVLYISTTYTPSWNKKSLQNIS